MVSIKHRKVISALLVAAFFVASSPMTYSSGTSNVYADELTDAQEKKKDATEKRKAAEARLKELENDKKDIVKVIEDLDNEICSYEETINELSTRRNALQAKAAVIENQLQNAYIAESQQYESMKERIQFAYENGDADYIEAIVTIKDYSNAINQSEYVSQVSSYDQKELNDLLDIEKNIYEYKSTISENITEIEDLRTEAEGEQEALQVMQDGKQATLKQYNAEISDTEISIEKLQAIEAEQNATIAAMEAQAQARRKAAEEAAAQQAAQQQAAQQAQQASATDASQQQAQQQQQQPVAPMNTYSGGAFRWPMPASSVITSYFGPRVSPTAGATSNHMGIDIGCPSGSSVVAAADGVVSYTGYLGGGGNCVMIDHGNGISTLYFHLSGFAVSVGQNVTAGQTIAYSGNTGISTGPHLHFAVRLNGSYVDPMGYL